MNDNSFKDASYYKTIVLSGGEGYEEYKSNVTSSTGNNSITSNSNQLVSNLNQQQQSGNNDNQLNITNPNNPISNCSNVMNLTSSSGINSNGAALLQSQNSFASSNYASNCDESSNGKDDLINYVITWEI